MLKFKKANLLESFNNSEINIIAIICNCTEGMKYGIAKDIAKNFPTVDNFDKLYDMVNQIDWKKFITPNFPIVSKATTLKSTLTSTPAIQKITKKLQVI